MASYHIHIFLCFHPYSYHAICHSMHARMSVSICCAVLLLFSQFSDGHIRKDCRSPSRCRFVLFPIQYHEHRSLLLDRGRDGSNNRMNDSERFFISRVLALFAASDGIVNKNILERFSNEVQVAEVCFYGSSDLNEFQTDLFL